MMGIVNPWTILAVVAGILSAAIGGYAKGYKDADRTALVQSLAKDLAFAKAQNDELLRQATAAQTVAHAAAERQRQAEARTADMQAEIEDYARTLASLPDAGCGFTDDDLRRLQSIGTAPRRAQAGPAGDPGHVRPREGANPKERGQP